MSTQEFPAKFGKYILLDRLNAGGMAEVFRAKVTGVEGFERLVAIKCMLPALLSDEQFSNMFIDEARLAAQVGHANVAQIYELGRHAERLYIAMELVSGRDLRHIIKTANTTGKPLPPEFAAYICSKAAEGLDFAHRKAGNDGKPLGLVHRDISPQNILVSYDGEVKVVDFGIAKANSAARDTQTQVGVLKGKFAYMSPEQVLGHDIDRRADIFALGSVLYEMVTGNRLFTGESDLTVLERVREGTLPDFNIALPSNAMRLVPVFEKALQVNPDQRFLWASEFAEALEPMLMGERNIFGPKRAAALMRAMYVNEVTELAEKLKKFASINESNCLVTIGESNTDPGSSREVFESTFASRKQSRAAEPDSDNGDTGVVPASRLEGTERTAKTPERPERPTVRPSAAQAKVVVPKPVPRPEPVRASAPTEIVRPIAAEATVVPTVRAPAASFVPTVVAAKAAAPYSTPVPHAQARGPGRGPITQVTTRPTRPISVVTSNPASVRKVVQRLKVISGLAIVVVGSSVLIVNASLPNPMTLSGTLDEMAQMHPVDFAQDSWDKAKKARLFDRLHMDHRANLPEVSSTSRFSPSAAGSSVGAAAGSAANEPVGAQVHEDDPLPVAGNPAREGYLRVTVLGAETAHVSVDDQDLGLAPTAAVKLKAGAHTVRVERQRSDGSVEHRESRIHIGGQHNQGQPLSVTLAF